MPLCPKHEASSFVSAQGCNSILNITFKFEFEIVFIAQVLWGIFFFFLYLSQRTFSTGQPGNS